MEIYQNMGGREEATLFAFGDKIPAVNATLVNSLMIRALDFNDIYWKEDPSHPSDLIPAALCTGEKAGVLMKDVIIAIVLAYEFEQRLCEFAVPGVRERGHQCRCRGRLFHARAQRERPTLGHCPA